MVRSFDCAGVEAKQGESPLFKGPVPCYPGECARSCRSKGFKNGFCRGGGVIPQYCACVNSTNFMGRKGGNEGKDDVGDGGSKSLFLEDEAMSP